MENIQKVNDYLTQAGTFYVSTVDGNKPKCRPFGFHMLEDGKIYFALGTFKDVYKQIVANTHVEICAVNGGGFLRYYGTAEFMDDEALCQKALNTIPQIKELYEANGLTIGVFYLKNATAEFHDMSTVKEKFQF